ncbi:TIGR01777 family oxidoreductase [Agromyces sp. SYSU K20354]|uniref:TIGR01777 family oxidoreductase n=1 Tax=Agromyces cavernae TaxID=2898659 RepID=UPI001E4FC5BE|nr:TIGR01777 family oxidoreductase [Agromyces cavernae]MCD2444184.1 TIGR01777 family oxidoreductase [Agromyces cavernae]
MATVVIGGSSGLIGTALAHSLRADGVTVMRLVRRPARRADEIEWLTGDRPLDPRLLAGAKAVVGLNGANIGRLPWTRKYRRILRESRLGPTRALATALRALADDAPAFVSASAVGYYGSRPGVELTEGSDPGTTFLARLCMDWEREARRAGDSCRVVAIRTAPILHRDGVLKPLIRLTALGVGGPIGRGTQTWPWISLEDEVRAIRHVIDSDIYGTVNLSGPTPATSNDIGRSIAHAMHRPFLVPVPEWALRLVVGRDLTESVLTTDARVRPVVLERTGFEFTYRTEHEATVAALAVTR